MKTFKTSKGTEIPLSNIKGKDYLLVPYRVLWFREEHPDWTIETEIRPKENECLSKATIKDENGRIIATSHKFEDVKGFGDFIEKSETGAIGRALALCGYGTQFTDELDEGDRLADSPLEKPQPKAPGKVAAPINPVIKPQPKLEVKTGFVNPPKSWEPPPHEDGDIPF